MNKYYIIVYGLMALQIINAMDESKQRVWNAKDYKENSSPQYHFAQYGLSQICFKEDDTVLDLGCGNGKITHDIAQKVPKGLVKGIDLSVDMINQAVFDYGNQKNLIFEQADMAAFTSKQKYNLAVAFCSLSWVKDQQKAYHNIANALESKGKLIALISDADSTILQAYRTTFADSKWKSYFKNYNTSYYPYNQESTKNHILQAGLNPIVVEKAAIPLITMSREDFVKALAGTPGVKDVVPQERYKDFLNDVVGEYLTKVPVDENGKVKIDSGLLLVIAEKS